MNKTFIQKFVLSLLLSSSPVFAMLAEENLDNPIYRSQKCTLDFAAGVKEINPHLYIGQKEPDLYFVMERIDAAVPESRLNFWRNYLYREWRNHDAYKAEWQKGNIPQGKGFLQFSSRDHILTGGLKSFDTSINNHNTNNELWIAYTSTKLITEANDITLDDVEMVVPVMTDKDAPMVTHMGISRSFHYLLQAIETEKQRIFEEKDSQDSSFKIHSGLSMYLQSFAAKVMRMRDENKLYVINAPVPAMRNIALKALPNHVYVRNLDAAKELHQTLKSSGEPFLSTALWNQKRDVGLELTSLRETLSNLINNNEENTNDSKIKELKIKKIELEKATEDLFQKFYDQKEKEIDECAEELTISQSIPPFKKIGQKIQIFDKTRQNIVFDHDRELKTIIVNNQTFVGGETDRYKWFYHADMCLNPYVAIDLDALSSYLQLVEDK